MLFGQLRLEDIDCGKFTAVVVKPQQISLRDTATGKIDEIICKHRVSRVVYGYGYMVVATTGPQVAVYNLKQASVLSPFTVDTLREPPSFMCLSERHLLLVDPQGLQLFTLDNAKPVSPPFQPKVAVRTAHTGAWHTPGERDRRSKRG